MSADLSAAPEIALLAAPYVTPTTWRPTVGQLASQLRVIAGQPELWWGRVRFSPLRYEKIELEIPGMWITVLAPDGEAMTCGCDALTVLAGTVADGSALLVPGRVRVHGEGRPHRLRAAGDEYAVSLHGRVSA